jgi:hypothetical protein
VRVAGAGNPGTTIGDRCLSALTGEIGTGGLEEASIETAGKSTMG